MHVNHTRTWQSEIKSLEEMIAVCEEVLKDAKEENVIEAAKGDLARLVAEKEHLTYLMNLH